MDKIVPNELRAKLAQRLREARVSAGLSQDNAAKQMNLQRPAISEIEAGNRKVSTDELKQFATLYKVRETWLLMEESDEELLKNEHFQYAARELSKLGKEDMEKVLAVLRMMKK